MILVGYWLDLGWILVANIKENTVGGDTCITPDVPLSVGVQLVPRPLLYPVYAISQKHTVNVYCRVKFILNSP